MIKETNLEFSNTLTRRTRTSSIVVHHGAGSVEETAESYHSMHLRRGWTGLGYHYVIEWDGTIKRGRPEWATGAHSRPVNATSIGICLIGDFTRHNPSEAQIKSLVWLIGDIWSRHPETVLAGHRDTDATLCPGHLFPWDRVKLELIEGVLNMIPVESWMINGGKEAVQALCDKGLINTPEKWSDDDVLTNTMPAGLVFILLNRIAEYGGK